MDTAVRVGLIVPPLACFDRWLLLLSDTKQHKTPDKGEQKAHNRDQTWSHAAVGFYSSAAMVKHKNQAAAMKSSDQAAMVKRTN